MNRITPAILTLLTGAGLALPASTAEAQCEHSDSTFCASVSVGASASASVRIGTPPPRNQQVVVVQPAPPPPPPVVVVQPTPPPPPPPRTVIVTRPVPPPTTVVVTQPQPTVVVPATQRRLHGWGIHGSIGGVIGRDVEMGGGSLAFRLRPGNGHFALDIGSGFYAGQDYNGLDRVEVPLTVDAILFANPESRFQFYGLVGVGASFAHAEGFQLDRSGRFGDDFVSRDYAYVGGQVGAGVEWRLSRFFALNADVRGFLRTRVDDNPEPEFVEIDEDTGLATGRTSDTSTGMTVNFGATFYF
ncbi:MAG: hypothetical protein AAGF12_09795 [Myxococcota bacterium]